MKDRVKFVLRVLMDTFWDFLIYIFSAFALYCKYGDSIPDYAWAMFSCIFSYIFMFYSPFSVFLQNGFSKYEKE